jgi:hypothetical protein
MSVELIQSGLRYAGMVRVNDPLTAERYNQCLQKFGLKPVATIPFHVDACGFSLEVASQLGDMGYLNPGGIARRFIIVSPQQEQAPFADITFSHSKEMMLSFYDANRTAISRLTLKDAIYGQPFETPDNSLGSVLSQRVIKLDVQTVNDTGRKAAELEGMVTSFRRQRNLWTDTGAMAKIVSLAKDIGDVRAGSMSFDNTTYAIPDHYSSSLNGGFAIIDGMILGDDATLVNAGKPPLPVLNTASGGQVLGNFVTKKMIEDFEPERIVSNGLLNHRLHCLAVELLPEDLVSDATGIFYRDFTDKLIPRDKGSPPRGAAFQSPLEALIQTHGNALSRDTRFEALLRLRKTITFMSPEDVDQTERSITAKVRLSLRRARKDHPAAKEINRVLCAYAPYDPVALFATDKDLFYREFEKRSPARQKFWIEAVWTSYMADKKNARVRLFG